MKSTSYLASVLAAGAAAFAPPAGHEYVAPGPSDVRSPCPGINALANHGFINRSGKNITVAQLVSGGMEGISIGPDFMSLIGGLALLSPAKPNGVSFDMDDLNEHNFPIEHDVSLTRRDDYFNGGNNIPLYKPYYDEFIKYFDGKEYTDLPTAAAARKNRIDFSLKNNPTVVYGPVAFAFGYGESGLYTQIMGSNPLALGAKVDYVKSLFLHERLPYEQGWQKSVLPVTLLTLGSYAFTLFGVTKENLPIGLEVFTVGTFRQILVDFAATAGKLKNVTTT